MDKSHIQKSCWNESSNLILNPTPSHDHLLQLVAHSLEEAREGIPVIKHEVTHAEERDLLQPTRARTTAKSTVGDALKGIVIVPAYCRTVLG